MIALLLTFAVAPPPPLSMAISRGLARLQDGAAAYTTHRTCFACHHQTLAISAARLALQKGFAVREGFLRSQTAFTLESFRTRLDKVRKGEGVGGGSTTVTYALFTLAEAGHPPDDVTAALIDYLLLKQSADGAWPKTSNRPPSEGSRFTDVALALLTLERYGDRTKVAGARDRAAAWLRKAEPKDHEDRVFRVLGLGEAESRDDLARRQNDDGSWSQLEKTPGDAYATATALVALRRAGLTGERLDRGVAYLLRTQGPRGEWLVTTRSRPVQTFFDNGDPGGKSQFISFLATGWAVRALLEAIPEPRRGG
jgi:N-acyl-D-amino-acid deacylase